MGAMQSVQIRPGYVVLDVSSATGGVHYQRREIEQHKIGPDHEGLQARHETVKTVDHVVAVKDVDAVVKQVDYAIRKYCAKTVFGPFADEDNLAKLQAEVAKIKAEAVEVNERAVAVGSARRAYIGIVPAKLDVVSPEAAEEIARTVREVLGDLRDALRVGDVGPRFDGVFLRSKNLANLAVGLQSDAVRFALDCVKEARKRVKDAIKKGETPESAGGSLDLGPVEQAIDLFTPLPPSLVGDTPSNDDSIA